MNKVSFYKLSLLTFALILIGPVLGPLSHYLNTQADPNGVLTLVAPAFVTTANANEEQVASFADDEAGIAAYFQAPSSIDLNHAIPLFRTIEDQTDSYIIGSTPIPESNDTYSWLTYDDWADAKLYVNTDGWVMAYYDKDAPTSRMFDWLNWDGGTTLPTTLEQVLKHVASAIGQPAPSPAYYHFAYPNANSLMLIAERKAGTDSFRVTLPAEFTYHETSYAIATIGGYTSTDATLSIDGVKIHTTGRGGWKLHYDEVPNPLSVDEPHDVAISGSTNQTHSGGLAIVYWVP